MIRETCKICQNCIWVARDQFHGQLHFLFLPDTNLFSFVRPAMEIFINMKVFVIIWVVLLNFSRIFILPWPKSKFPVSCEERCALFTFYTYVCPVLSKKLRQSRSFFLSFLSFILIHRITWKQWISPSFLPFLAIYYTPPSLQKVQERYPIIKLRSYLWSSSCGIRPKPCCCFCIYGFSQQTLPKLIHISKLCKIC